MVVAASSYEQLGRYRQEIMTLLNEYPGLTNLDIDYRETQPQYHIDINRDRASDMGVSVRSIGQELETMMGGRRVTTYESDGEEYDVILQATEQDRMLPTDMTNMYVRSSRTGELIPLSNLVTVEEKSGASSLRRFNRERALTLQRALLPAMHWDRC